MSLPEVQIRLPGRFNLKTMGQQLLSPLMGIASPEKAFRNGALTLATHEPFKSLFVPLVFEFGYGLNLDPESRANLKKAVEASAADPTTVCVIASRHSNHGDHGANVNLLQLLKKEVKKKLGPEFIDGHTVSVVLASQDVWEKNPKFKTLVDNLGPVFNIYTAPIIQSYQVKQGKHTTVEAATTYKHLLKQLKGFLDQRRLASVLIYPEGTREPQGGSVTKGERGLEELVRFISQSAPVVVLPVNPVFRPDYERDRLNPHMLVTEKIGELFFIPEGSNKEAIPTSDKIMTRVAALTPGKEGYYEEAVKTLGKH